jgi:TolB-like protein
VALFLSWYFSRDKLEDDDYPEAAPGKRAPGFLKVLLKRPLFSIPGTFMFILIIFSLIRLIYRHSVGLNNTITQSQTEISLAVLPFTNFTGDAEQDWLVAGQHETLINELPKISQVRPLRVISRHTVNAFKNFDKLLPDIARKINVEYLVEASVLSFGDSITLQLRLIQVYPEENVIWAESCSSDFTNVLKLHGGIAGQIAEKMNLELSPEDMEKIPAPHEVNPESYKAYLRGMYHLNKLTPEGMEKGLEYLHEAVRLDPNEPFAYAGLALELNPNLALTHYHYAWALYLFGRMEEAITEHILARKYDPFNPLHTA